MNNPLPYAIILVEHCLQQFTALTAIEGTWGEWPGQDDPRVTLHFPHGPVDYRTEVKGRIDRFSMLDALKADPWIDQRTLLITRYLSPELLARCRELEIQCLDSAGNAYLNTSSGGFVLISGRRPAAQPAMPAEPKTMTASGLRILFALFAQPDLLNATYRDIASAAGASLGLVGPVLAQLSERGFLGTDGSGRRAFLHRRRLAVEWASNYIGQLRPKLAKRRFHVPNLDQLHSMKLPSADGMTWSGEAAAAVQTSYLRPETFTLYADMRSPSIAALASRLRMRPDAQGELEIIEPFWNPAVLDIEGIAPPELIYADLLAVLDPRKHETADLVLQRLIGHE